MRPDQFLDEMRFRNFAQLTFLVGAYSNATSAVDNVGAPTNENGVTVTVDESTSSSRQRSSRRHSRRVLSWKDEITAGENNSGVTVITWPCSGGDKNEDRVCIAPSSISGNDPCWKYLTYNVPTTSPTCTFEVGLYCETEYKLRIRRGFGRYNEIPKIFTTGPCPTPRPSTAPSPSPSESPTTLDPTAPTPDPTAVPTSQSPTLPLGCDASQPGRGLCPAGGAYDGQTALCKISPPERTVAAVDNDGVWSYSPFPDPLFGAPFGFNPSCPTVEGETFATQFDSNDCLVGVAPDGPYTFVPGGPNRPFRFVFEGAFYYMPVDDPDNRPCPYAPYDASGQVELKDETGSFDACLVAEIPEGFDGFIDGQKFRTGHSHVCPSITCGETYSIDGTYDGAKCRVWDEGELGYNLNGYVEDDVFVYPSCPTLNNFHQDIFQSELEEFCSNFDCSGDASEVASAVYDLLPDGTRSALSNGRFFQSGCFNFDSILSESVNAGDYSGAVLPLMNLLSRWVPDWIDGVCRNDGSYWQWENDDEMLTCNGFQSSLTSCCYNFSWRFEECMDGSRSQSQPEPEPPSRWYPVWSGVNLCVNDGNEEHFVAGLGWVYTSAQSCCTQHFQWAFARCMGRLDEEGSNNPQIGVTCEDPCPLGGHQDLTRGVCETSPPEGTVAIVVDGVWSYSPFPDPGWLRRQSFAFRPVCPFFDGQMAPFDDNGDCLIGIAPDGPYTFLPGGPIRPLRFVFEGAFYYMPVDDPGNGPCPYTPYATSGEVELEDETGSFNACLVAEIPEGFDGFITDRVKFFTGYSSICPSATTNPQIDGTYDGTTCYILDENEVGFNLNGYVDGNVFVYSSCPTLSGNRFRPNYSNKYFVDYETGSCWKDCDLNVPRCAEVPPPVSLYDNIELCCSVGQNWVDYLYCTSRSIGGYTGGWIVDYSTMKCSKDCDPSEGLPCANPKHEDLSAKIYSTAQECCGRLNWLDQSDCVADSKNTQNVELYTGKFYADWMNNKCARDCDAASDLPCLGNPGASLQLYEDVQSCCTQNLSWINIEQCTADTFGISTQTSGFGEWYVDWDIVGPGGQKEGKCVQDCGIDEDSPPSCGGLKANWATGYGSADDCCAAISWVPADRCHL